MEALINDCIKYINDTLGVKTEVSEWVQSYELPLYLRERYKIFRMELLSFFFLLAIPTDMEDQTPAVIEKHLAQIAVRSDENVVYLRDHISSYDRKRMIERKIPFIIPGRQMYMPFLAIDLREHFNSYQRTNKTFSPATQYLLLYLLQQPYNTEKSSSELANLLGYSGMTITRAFHELENTNIGKYVKYGKDKYICLSHPKSDIWGNALPYLESPVQRKVYLKSYDHLDANPDKFKIAGQSALARITMIAEPKIATYAIRGIQWKEHLRQGYEELPYPDYNAFELELWRYPVEIAGDSNMVDKLSLYLSLKDSTDERIQGALHVLLEDILW